MSQSGASKVSVVITTYNHARFLADALDSVMLQSVRPDEIIVVDDGSTDEPGAIVQKYKDVSFITQTNQGLAAARNTGWRMATGDFVAFLDADDRLRPNAISTNLQLFRVHSDCGFVYGAYCYVDEAGNFQNAIRLRSVGQDAFCGFLTGNLIGMHGTVLYKRSKLKKVGGFDQSLPVCEDYDMYLRLSQRYPTACSDTCLAEYRRHSFNLSRNTPLMMSTVLKVLERQWPLAQTRPEWTAAYRRGLLGWKYYYAEDQASRLIGALRSRSNLVRQLQNSASVALMAPSASLKAWGRRLERWRQSRRSRRLVQFGELFRTSPFSNQYGFDRGKPIDRRYVEEFLATWSSDIRGRVLEVGDNEYTIRFGGSQVTKSDILNRYEGNPSTTFVSDLSHGAGIPSDAFDCVVLTQTLHLIFDIGSAVQTLRRILKPGGVLLVTVPWVSPIDRGEWRDSWYWSLSPACLRQLLSLHFAHAEVQVAHYGNVYSATAFLYGLAERELKFEYLDSHDPCCPVIVAARVRKR